MKKLLLLALFPILQGCFITQTPGFYSGYKRLPEAEQRRIQFLPANSSIPDTSSRLIYAISAESLLKKLGESDTSLVYMWSPNCSSVACASLSYVQHWCDARGYKLYVVAEYYDIEQIDVQPTLRTPMLAVNHKAYKTDYCPRYTRLFTEDLRGEKQLPDSARYARYYLFEGKKFVRAIPILDGKAL